MQGDPTLYRFLDGLLALIFFGVGSAVVLGVSDVGVVAEVGIPFLLMGLWGVVGIAFPRAGIARWGLYLPAGLLDL